MKTILKKLIRLKLFFPVWNYLYRLSLFGMNIGPGGGVSQSGERWVIKFVGRHLNRDKPVIFDVGANQGDYSRAVMDILDNKASTYSFEPSKATFSILEKNLEKYPSARLFNFGFSDENLSAPLYSNKDGSTLASLYHRDLQHVDIDMSDTETIELRVLDEFCQENNIDRIDFLKLDVEGHELSVLKGATKLLESRHISFIQFEFGGCNIDSRTYFKDFYYTLNPGYRIYRILFNGIYPVSSYDETLETFLTANFLAISRDMECEV